MSPLQPRYHSRIYSRLKKTPPQYLRSMVGVPQLSLRSQKETNMTTLVQYNSGWIFALEGSVLVETHICIVMTQCERIWVC